MTELDPQSRRILALAREARTPSPADKARVAERFAVALGVSAGLAGGAAAAQAAPTTGLAKAGGVIASFKWWITGSAVLVAAAGGYASLATPAQPRPAPEQAATPAPAVPQPTAAPVLAPAAPPAHEPELQAELAPERIKPVSSGRPGRANRTLLPRELELLHQAQAAWREHQARRALSLLEQHRARYPRSDLRAEREGLQILTLCELGRKRAADRLARDLLTRAPDSPLRASIEQSCAAPTPRPRPKVRR